MRMFVTVLPSHHASSAAPTESAAPCLTTALRVLTSIPVAPRFRFVESILHYIIVEAWSPNVSLRLP